MEWTRGDYAISTDPARVDLDAVHRYLSEDSYWARGIPRDVVERSLAHSLVFGLYREAALAGFARVVTDRATFAYLGDVFVLPGHRGGGLGVWLVETVLSHPDLKGLRGFMLATDDAHALYARFGFVPLPGPEKWMGRPGTPYGRGGG